MDAFKSAGIIRQVLCRFSSIASKISSLLTCEERQDMSPFFQDPFSFFEEPEPFLHCLIAGYIAKSRNNPFVSFKTA